MATACQSTPSPPSSPPHQTSRTPEYKCISGLALQFVDDDVVHSKIQ
ncbi:1297_t:CDS:2 [Entrophospora sp. SA101]|nr:1297_t:CDS:2 [Entrophospora sp. SA101]